MTKQQYYLGQAPWFIIKQFLGLYPEYSYSKFKELEVEVIQTIWDMFGPRAACYIEYSAHPEPYTRQNYNWHETKERDNISLNAFRNTRPSGNYIPRNVIEYYVSKGGWNNTPRIPHKEFSDIYYDIYGSDIIKATNHLNKLLNKDQEWRHTIIHGANSIGRHKPIVKLPIIDRYDVPASIREELELVIEKTSSSNASQAHKHASSAIKKIIFAACPNEPKRANIYKALNSAVVQKKRLCLCGQIIPTADQSMLDRHFLSNKHCKGVMKKGNLTVIKNWYKNTGILPPGFTYNPSDDTLEHIIPIDLKRSGNHIIQHQNSVDLCQYITSASDGMGSIAALPIYD